MTGYAQMVTQFHTLLHFVTLFPMILSPTACVAASTRIQGVSKSHLLSIIHAYTIHRSGACASYVITKPNVYGSHSSVKTLYYYSYDHT
jgi:hypothetical protein